jgi:hypothetical protein
MSIDGFVEELRPLRSIVQALFWNSGKDKPSPAQGKPRDCNSNGLRDCALGGSDYGLF